MKDELSKFREEQAEMQKFRKDLMESKALEETKRKKQEERERIKMELKQQLADLEKPSP